MKFEEINDDDYIYPGIHLYHAPSNAIILCTAYTGDTIKGFLNGKLMEDKKETFKKVLITRDDRKKGIGGCKGCGG
tara:strand:- start:128 stop:355 length:228 start_codon:yes stop_codon:yes gene_type:complete